MGTKDSPQVHGDYQLVHVYLTPSDRNYLRAKLVKTNVQRLIALGYRVEPQEEKEGGSQ